MASIHYRLERLLKRVQSMRPRRSPLTRYRSDPVGYARDVLGVEPWGLQQEIGRAVLEPPYRILVPSGHSSGKTFTGAWLTSWWYDTRDPGVVITTAPTARQVQDLLWKEIRLQRSARGLGGFTGPRSPELWSAPDHNAKGFTASTGEGFQGRHDCEMLFLFDEAVGIDPIFWETTANGMFKPEQGHAWVCFFNPTDTTSRAYLECSKCGPDGSPLWRQVRINCLEHPNVTAQLQGLPPPVPNAVSLSQIEDSIASECDPIDPADAGADDLEWPPGSGTWYRPGPVFQSRWMGLWPSQGTYGVWSDALWSAALRPLPIPARTFPEVGCDVARFGDDYTEIHARAGPVSVHHEAHNGWSTVQTAGRLRELTRELAKAHDCLSYRIPVKVDDDGVGGGVIDQLQHADGPGDRVQVIPVNAGRAPTRPGEYPNLRSELWFVTAQRARRGLLSLALLPREVQQRLQQQAMAPVWKLDVAGRRVVEPKDKTKEKLGRSPDGLDALNLAYFEAPAAAVQGFVPEQPDRGERRGHGFGR